MIFITEELLCPVMEEDIPASLKDRLAEERLVVLVHSS